MKLLPMIIAYFAVAAALPTPETSIFNEPKGTSESVHPLAITVRRAIDYGFSRIIKDLGKLPVVVALLYYVDNRLAAFPMNVKLSSLR